MICNTRQAAVATEGGDDFFEEFDSPETIAAVEGALASLGVQVEPVEADRRLPWRLEGGKYDIGFNMAEGLGRRCREAIPAAICELLDLPFTGSDAVTLGVTLDKFLARRIVTPELNVAGAVLVHDTPDPLALSRLRYPVLVKPNDEGSSKGVRGDSIAADPSRAHALSLDLHARYGCPVLVEEFLPGAEITIGVAGNGANTRILGMMEISPVDTASPFVYSLDVKRDFRRSVRYYIPPRVSAGLQASAYSDANQPAIPIHSSR